MKRKALVLVFNNLKHDARVNRQINFLLKDFKVTVVAFDTIENQTFSFLKIIQTPLTLVTKARMGFWLATKNYIRAYRAFHNYSELTLELAQQAWDLIVANDVDTLPMAFQIKGKTKSKIIFDAHEYSPRHFEDRWFWRTFFQPFYVYICSTYIPKVDAMLTVGRGLANEYEKNFGRKPVLITNATRRFEIEPTIPEENKIKLVHHGIANPSRRLELMIEMMSYLDDRFTLDLILMTSDFASGRTKDYIENLKVEFEKDSRIKILPSVQSHEVVPTINKYDIGIFLLPPVNFNYENTLPNKLFDFIQAKLAIAIGPTPEMAAIVTEYSLGVVSETFDPKDLAEQLSKISREDLMRFKNNSVKASQELCAEKNELIWQGIINNLFPN